MASIAKGWLTTRRWQRSGDRRSRLRRCRNATHRPRAAVRRNRSPWVPALPYPLLDMTTHTDVLAVTGARKKFADVVALDGATLSLREGELLAVLGPDGAGKATLIRAISGRGRLDAGDVTL